MSPSVKDFRPVSFCMDRCTAASATYVSVFPYTSFWVTSIIITCYGSGLVSQDNYVGFVVGATEVALWGAFTAETRTYEDTL